MITLNQSTKTEQNYAKWILTALLFKSKLKIFMKTLLMMLKNGLTNLAMTKMIKEHLQQVRTKQKSVFLKMNWVERL